METSTWFCENTNCFLNIFFGLLKKKHPAINPGQLFLQVITDLLNQRSYNLKRTI